MVKLSIIIPVYNEVESVKKVIDDLKKEVAGLPNFEYEIVVVNDGSTDGSRKILEQINDIKLLNHPYNKGYGASLKTGSQEAKYGWLLFFDSDGQHKPEYIKEFIKYTGDYDMIAGVRQGYHGPLWRQPGKKILSIIANYLAERKIPDLNCGFRMMEKNYFLQYQHLFPNNFSLSTTSTLAFLKEGLNVKYVPITVNKRCGKSCVRVSDGFKTIMLIIRLIMLFSPLKIFVPLALFGFFISGVWLIHDLAVSNFALISKSIGFVFTASLLIFVFGLLADQVAAIRREIKK